MALEHVYLSTNRYRVVLTNEAGVPQDGATVTTTIYQGSTPVTGVSWPQTMTGQGGGTGRYDYTPPTTIGLVPGRTYRVVINADLAGVKAHNDVPVVCVKDES